MVAFWAFTDKSWGTRLAGLLYEIPLIVWQDAQKAQHGIVAENTESIVVITFSLGERTSGEIADDLASVQAGWRSQQDTVPREAFLPLPYGIFSFRT